MPENPSAHNKLKLLTASASVAVALTLLGLKALAIARTDSVSVLASATDSGLDFLSSLIIFAAMYAATRPADNEHRYGHGKLEALAGLGQACLVALSAGYVLWHALSPVARGSSLSALRNPGLALGVMSVSLALTAALVVFQSAVARRTESLAIQADRLHYLSDLLANGGVIVALVTEAYLGVPHLDRLAGCLVAAYILYSSYGILRQSLDVLMDRDISDRYRRELDFFVRTESAVLAYHDLRSRSAGDTRFLEVHLDLERTLSFEESHRLCEKLITRLKAQDAVLRATIHADPARTDADGQVESSMPHDKRGRFR